MNLDAERPAGPDFLANVAQQNLASGLLENATEFRVRAAEWQSDHARIEQLERVNADLESRLRRIDSAVKGG